MLKILMSTNTHARLSVVCLFETETSERKCDTSHYNWSAFNDGAMHLRILLGIVGQLIAIPAALFFVPTTYPKLFSAPGATVDSSSAEVVQEDIAIMTNPDAISAQDR